MTHALAVRVVGLVLAVVGAAAAASGAAQSALTEAQAKAGFLYNCAMFVTWPHGSSHGPELVIGVVGDDAVAGVIDGMQGREVNGRVLRVRKFKSGEDLTGAHIVFVGRGEPRATSAIVEQLGEAAVLTVGEHDDFTKKGGVVRLYTERDRLRFEVNMTRVERVGLKVSAKMLGLAKIVR